MVAKRFSVVIAVLLAAGVGKVSGAEDRLTPLPPLKQAIAVRDVALGASGVLAGQLLDSQGSAVANASLSVANLGKEIAQATTDQQGRFRVEGLRGGVHQVVAGGQVTVCRLWAPQTAPPSAQPSILLVAETEVVRGQCVGCGTPVCGSPVCGSGCGGVYGRGAGGGGVINWMANHPLITAGGIAAAIAVPLAVDDDDPPATP